MQPSTHCAQALQDQHSPACQSFAGLGVVAVVTPVSVDLTTLTRTPCAISTSTCSSSTFVTLPIRPAAGHDLIAARDRVDHRALFLDPPRLRGE